VAGSFRDILSYCSAIFIEGLRMLKKFSARMAGVLAEIRTGHPLPEYRSEPLLVEPTCSVMCRKIIAA
jgi:hypothetical protein